MTQHVKQLKPLETMSSRIARAKGNSWLTNDALLPHTINA